MDYAYDKKEIANLDRRHLPEWYLADGMGGYTAGSMTNVLFRKHHGYLVSSMNPPTDRMLYLAKTEEALTVEGHCADFGAQTYADGKQRYGDAFLVAFRLDEVVHFTYQALGVRLDKTIAPRHGGKAVAIEYKVTTGDAPATLAVTPFFHYRSHGGAETGIDPVFKVTANGGSLELHPQANPALTIRAVADTGTFEPTVDPYDRGLSFAFDAATGDDRTDILYRPHRLVVPLSARLTKTFSLVVSLGDIIPDSAAVIIDDYQRRIRDIIETAAMPDDFSRRLVRAADQFIAHRKSTGLTTILAGLPWFADWGRDTMIAFEGLTLVTKRFSEAREILLSFARFERHGLIPNMFPDADAEPLYNTADASLWYIHAINRYLDYTGDETTAKSLFPVVEKIIYSYQNGTRFDIGMDADGLIHAGSGFDQVTWMDVRVDGIVVTPRHGKPVEINALWYNALRSADDMAHRLGERSHGYRQLAGKVKNSFNRRFWNESTQCLYDVVDQDDPSIRPNQLFAVSLPYPLVAKDRIKKIVRTLTKELLDVYGLRSLAISDPRFVCEYSGSLRKRDFAYHMGTTWAFLIGPYIDAYLRAYDHSEQAKNEMRTLCLRFERHLREGCIGGVAEIFDGKNGTISRGCGTQAWSVGELLRAYVGNGLDHIQGDEK
ncbi:MAG: amylo-alpha-1,6-glucosidase [bacterium]